MKQKCLSLSLTFNFQKTLINRLGEVSALVFFYFVICKTVSSMQQSVQLEIESKLISATNNKNMNFEKLVPNIFYVDINDGLKMFVDCLGFEIGHDERNSAQPFCVVEKDGLRINLFQDSVQAKEHNPEFRLVTKNIAEVYEKVSKSHPEFLHPNLNKITLRPWGAKEFALMDKQLGIRIQEW